MEHLTRAGPRDGRHGVKRKGQHHRGPHQRLSAQARAIFNADPLTLCARCGQPRRPGDPLQAGHRHDGIVAVSLADYQPEHRSCNAAAGARLGNQRRQGLGVTRDW